MTLGPANLASPSPRCLENIRVFQMATGRSTLQPRSGSERLRDWGFCSDGPAVRLLASLRPAPGGQTQHWSGRERSGRTERCPQTPLSS